MKNRKQLLREKYKKIRDAIPLGTRKNAAKKIAAKLFQLKEFKLAKNIALYSTIGSEVQTELIFKKAEQLKKKVFYPRVAPGKKELSFHFVANPKNFMFPGPYGILQPKINTPSLRDTPFASLFCFAKSLRAEKGNLSGLKLDIILVPGIAFDKKGFRLGYGKGYYDRVLGKNPKMFSIGLCYNKTFVPSLPHHSHDQPVHCIVTEKEVVRI